ncbi:MAG: hypothetical protein ABI442_06315 [Gemmatimonadaceae bacterium]
MFKAAGSPKGKTKVDYIGEAEKNLTNAKFIKQVGHRGQAEQSICGTCKHEKGMHFTKSGAPKLSGKKCDAPACTCTGWVELKAYEPKRAGQGKPDVNPLAGATTNKNTVISMNKIPKATFQQVVLDALIAKEKERFGKTPAEAWGQGHTGKELDCEHLEWDFKILGSVVFIEGGDPSKWEQRQKVNVTVKNLKSTDPLKPSYSVVHMMG